MLATPSGQQPALVGRRSSPQAVREQRGVLPRTSRDRAKDREGPGCSEARREGSREPADGARSIAREAVAGSTSELGGLAFIF